ncbi:hypothetical protein ACLVWU_11940 [Bdellovibrio sp. HCB290]|uniref:hypothetical protein n=1 Tax=Bdellovibrio sp. HCB290 TaxID=3394356 RepID=UPI0039B5F66A
MIAPAASMTKFLSILLLGVCVGVGLQPRAALASSGKTLTDTLVKDLSCRGLSVNSIYAAIQPKSSFHVFYHIPVQNWYFKSGGPNLGVCWGLASVQRKMFYLARFEEQEEISKEELVRRTLNMVRGHELSPLQTGGGRERMLKTPIHSYEVLKYSDLSLLSSWAAEEKVPNGLFPLINKGYKEVVNNESHWKTFKLDVERAQQERFFRGSNLSMVTPAEDNRSAVDNLLTFSTLKKNLEGHRLTLLNLRFGRYDQHVVVAKEITRIDDKIAIIVYDSNSPLQNGVIYYDENTKSFHTPGIYKGVVNEGDPERAIGVYVIDEEERGPIEAAMLRYYQAQCQK